MIDEYELTGPGVSESATGTGAMKWGILLNSCLFWDSMMLFSEGANKAFVEESGLRNSFLKQVDEVIEGINSLIKEAKQNGCKHSWPSYNVD